MRSPIRIERKFRLNRRAWWLLVPLLIPLVIRLAGSNYPAMSEMTWYWIGCCSVLMFWLNGIEIYDHLDKPEDRSDPHRAPVL